MPSSSFFSVLVKTSMHHILVMGHSEDFTNVESAPNQEDCEMTDFQANRSQQKDTRTS